MTPTSFPKDKIKVVLLEGVHDRGALMFKGESFDVTRHAKALDGPELVAAVRDAHVVGIRSKTQLAEGVLEAAHRLLAVGCFCIGTNQVDLDAARTRGCRFLTVRLAIRGLSRS